MKTLNFYESQKIVKKYGIPFVKCDFVKKEEDLKKIKIKFPWAMKIVSSKINHKTDKKGVILEIKNFNEAKKAFNKLKKLPGFESIAIQKQLTGYEIIIGGKYDEQFGPTVLIGLGGIFTEIWKDFSLRICPINKKECLDMIKELKAYPILAGARGKKSINLTKLTEIIFKANNLMLKEKNIKELDLNPIICSGKEILAVDARIVKGEKK